MRAAASVACIAILIVWHNEPIIDAPGDARLLVITGSMQIPPSTNLALKTQEIALYTWANTAPRSPEPVASALLVPRMRSGKRPVEVEILALDLANATMARAGKLEPLAALHKPIPGGRTRSERHGRQVRSNSPRA
jgi:hypothetical protein